MIKRGNENFINPGIYCNQTVQIVIIYYIISLIKHFLLVDNKLSIE